MARFLVTGGAGFIGSHLSERLLEDGHSVVIYDNFSTGQAQFVENARQCPRCSVVVGDVLDENCLASAVAGCDGVYHLAANADVRFGLEHPRRDLEQNTIATSNVLEAMRLTGVHRIAFSSTGSVYGDHHVFPTPEDAAFPVQTSLYGASKLACEALIQAYAEGYGFVTRIFRFVSILGERYTHGHVFDFCKQLLLHPDHLYVLGDGTQRKSYLYVRDCVEALSIAFEAPTEALVVNLGTNEYCTVTDSIAWITGALGLSPRIEFAGGDRGWVGDSPFILLDCARMRSLGWAPTLKVRDAIIATVHWLDDNPWVFDARG